MLEKCRKFINQFEHCKHLNSLQIRYITHKYLQRKYIVHKSSKHTDNYTFHKLWQCININHKMLQIINNSSVIKTCMFTIINYYQLCIQFKKCYSLSKYVTKYTPQIHILLVHYEFQPISNNYSNTENLYMSTYERHAVRHVVSFPCLLELYGSKMSAQLPDATKHIKLHLQSKERPLNSIYTQMSTELNVHQSPLD